MDGAGTSGRPSGFGGPGGQSMLGFDFRGTTWDYYGVYIVNVLLMVVTLGIYSAWAKVRNRRFFYGNTYLKGHNFDFDARPTTILMSRIIVLAVVVGFTFSQDYFNLFLGGLGLLSLALFLLFPFAVVRGRAFNARHAIHRSVRFRYLLDYRPSFWLFSVYFLPGLMLSAIAASTYARGTDDQLAAAWSVALLYYVLLAPGYYLFKHRIMIGQLKFGKLSFSYESSLKAYYKNAIIAFLISWLFLTLVYGSVLVFMWFVASQGSYAGAEKEWDGLILAFSAIFVIVAPFIVMGLYRSRMLPIFYSSIKLSDGSSLANSLSANTYFFKYFLVNVTAVIFSLGLLLPWARVRTWRYVTDNLALVLSRDTGAVLASPEEAISPLAEELADIQGFDLDFGVI